MLVYFKRACWDGLNFVNGSPRIITRPDTFGTQNLSGKCEVCVVNIFEPVYWVASYGAKLSGCSTIDFCNSLYMFSRKKSEALGLFVDVGHIGQITLIFVFFFFSILDFLSVFLASAVRGPLFGYLPINFVNVSHLCNFKISSFYPTNSSSIYKRSLLSTISYLLFIWK